MNFKFLIIIFVVVFIGCKKDSPPDDNNPSLDNITLIYPVKDTTINPCCINFLWETTLSGEYRLTVSTHETFSHPVIDTLVTSKEFLYPTFYQIIPIPGVRYYWRVKQGALEQTEIFKIKDILAEFEGNYVVEVNKYSWSIGIDTCCDTSYTTTISIFKNGINAIVSAPDDNLYGTFGFNAFHTAYYEYFYVYINSTTSAFLYLRDITDSVFVEFNVGGHGGGTTWAMKGKR